MEIFSTGTFSDHGEVWFKSKIHKYFQSNPIHNTGYSIIVQYSLNFSIYLMDISVVVKKSIYYITFSNLFTFLSDYNPHHDFILMYNFIPRSVHVGQDRIRFIIGIIVCASILLWLTNCKLYAFRIFNKAQTTE